MQLLVGYSAGSHSTITRALCQNTRPCASVHGRFDAAASLERRAKKIVKDTSQLTTVPIATINNSCWKCNDQCRSPNGRVPLFNNYKQTVEQS